MASTNITNYISDFTVSETRFITGSKLIGACASWMFLAFMIVQTFIYFQNYKNDSKFLKSTVCFVVLLQIAQTGTESYNSFAIDSLGWGDPEKYYDDTITLADDLQPLFESLTGFIVQCFLIWRIWAFSMAYIQHPKVRMFIRLVCVFVAFICGFSLSAGIIVTTQSLIGGDIPVWYTGIVVSWNVSSAATDITITACMMALLLHAKASSCFGETRNLLSRLIRIILQTGLLTTTLALLFMSLFLNSLDGLDLLPMYILGKSYVISLLANLNARKRSNEPMVHGSGIDQGIRLAELSTLRFSPKNCHAEGGRENSDSITPSFPVHSVKGLNSLHRFTKEDIAEESGRENETKSNPQNGDLESNLQLTYNG